MTGPTIGAVHLTFSGHQVTWFPTEVIARQLTLYTSNECFRPRRMSWERNSVVSSGADQPCGGTLPTAVSRAHRGLSPI